MAGYRTTKVRGKPLFWSVEAVRGEIDGIPGDLSYKASVSMAFGPPVYTATFPSDRAVFLSLSVGNRGAVYPKGYGLDPHALQAAKGAALAFAKAWQPKLTEGDVPRLVSEMVASIEAIWSKAGGSPIGDREAAPLDEALTEFFRDKLAYQEAEAANEG